ncbi:MAG: hypothetical protein L0Y73_01745 [Candidatus Aminicenantes bacterium]|nr:hypothetical protein [Candidatus Aminicenantes bacterium]
MPVFTGIYYDSIIIRSLLEIVKANIKNPHLARFLLSPAACNLRNELLKVFRFAFRNDKESLDTLKSIAKKNTHAAMIQDLNTLSCIGEDNTAVLAAVNFDMSLREIFY